MNRLSIPCAAILCAWLGAQGSSATPVPNAPPIAFASVDRAPPKLPRKTDAARFGIYLFGDDGRTRVWAVLDRTAERAADRTTGQPGFDVLWFDRDADGTLTEPGERIAATPCGKDPADLEFVVGDYRPPGSKVVHKDLRIRWTADGGVRFKMLWRGEKISFGGYGPTRETYAQFGETPATAPVFVPGWDRPFAFERWIDEPLRRDKDVEFKVFVGNRGDRTGAFSAVDDKFLPPQEYAVATLHYQDRDGKPATASFELKQRC